jgi:hypothetical protein
MADVSLFPKFYRKEKTLTIEIVKRKIVVTINLMNRLSLLLTTISFFILGIIEAMLYYMLYDRYLLVAIIQWPLLTALYTSFLINLLKETGFNRRSLYFTGYFTAVGLVLCAFCFYVGFAGLLLAMPLSSISAFYFLKGIQLFISSAYAFPRYGILGIGVLAYIVNLLLLIPLVSDLLRPIHYNKGSIVNVTTPFFALWTFFVGSYSIFCLYYKRENPYYIQ